MASAENAGRGGQARRRLTAPAGALHQAIGTDDQVAATCPSANNKPGEDRAQGENRTVTQPRRQSLPVIWVTDRHKRSAVSRMSAPVSGLMSSQLPLRIGDSSIVMFGPTEPQPHALVR